MLKTHYEKRNACAKVNFEKILPSRKITPFGKGAWGKPLLQKDVILSFECVGLRIHIRSRTYVRSLMAHLARLLENLN